jgi:hypothetical protein
MTFGERNRNPGHHFAGIQNMTNFLFKQAGMDDGTSAAATTAIN